MTVESSSVYLYWLPLGAGGHSVRLNGVVFESVVARLERRTACDLYHSALEVRAPSGRFVIEQAPIRDNDGARRGVVAEGAVGSRLAGRLRVFRYEVRRWRNGVIPDATEAVASPQLLTGDPGQAQRLLDLVPEVPTPVWGRDELDAGEMWNSNSLISLARRQDNSSFRRRDRHARARHTTASSTAGQKSSWPAQRAGLLTGKWRGPDSNRRHPGFQPSALPAELPRRWRSAV